MNIDTLNAHGGFGSTRSHARLRVGEILTIAAVLLNTVRALGSIAEGSPSPRGLKCKSRAFARLLLLFWRRASSPPSNLVSPCHRFLGCQLIVSASTSSSPFVWRGRTRLVLFTTGRTGQSRRQTLERAHIRFTFLLRVPRRLGGRADC